MTRISFLRWFYRYHLFIFLPLILLSPLISLGVVWIIASVFPFVSFVGFIVLAAILTLVAGFYNRMAFRQTLVAFRYYGMGVEKNPVTRFFFRKLSLRTMKVLVPSMLALVSLLIGIELYLQNGLWVFGYTIILWPWFMLVFITYFDATNDVLANSTMFYLMKKDKSGWIYRPFLPYPSYANKLLAFMVREKLTKEDIVEFLEMYAK